MFYVGQRVVCVDDQPEEGTAWYGDAPSKGAVYTIVRTSVLRTRNIPILFFSELRRPNEDEGYLARRFRPVTDISTLQAIVAEVKTGKPRKIEADRFDKVSS